MEEQLIKKNCSTGEYENIYPITSLSSIMDVSTGETLDRTLERFNHIYLPFKSNSKAVTRNQIPDKYRRKGLFITYVACSGKTITEYYNNEDFSDRAWGDNSNWIICPNMKSIQDLVKESLSWYKS